MLARKALALAGDVQIVAWVQRVQDLEVAVDAATVTTAAVDANIVRCPDATAAAQMITLIDDARKAGDSLGGVVEAVARGVPAGWGEPVFDRLEADLAKAMLSLPASKGRTLPRALRAPSCVKMVVTSAGREALTPPASIMRLRPARSSSTAEATASSDEEHAASTR